MEVQLVAFAEVIQQPSCPKFCNRDAELAENPLAVL